LRMRAGLRSTVDSARPSPPFILAAISSLV
jgi:hypothetical protein